MAIPGLRSRLDVRAKVRIGEKKRSVKGVEYPASVDHFLCEDADFPAGKTQSLRIFFPYAKADENFSTGLEWWQGKLLACYSKGEEKDGVPVALRRASMKQGGQTVNLLEGTRLLSEETVGQDRRLIECPVRECPILKRKDCKPMGRLLFWIDGLDTKAGVFQLDTKSWNSIEALEGTLAQYPDLRGIPFNLSVAFVQRGTDRFPVLKLEEAVEINTEADVTLADALVQLRKAYDLQEEDIHGSSCREPLAAVLDLDFPGWRANEELVERLKAAGPVRAAEKMLEKHGV